MDYEFELNYRGDIILYSEEKVHNFGYNHIDKFPIMFWLNNMNSGKNIYEEMSLNEEKVEVERDLENLVQDSIIILKKFPIALEEFNEEINRLRANRFTAGSNKIFYEFSLGEDNLLYLKKSYRDNSEEEIDLALKPGQVKSLALEYLGFINGEQKMQKFHDRMKFIVQKLGQYNRIT